MQQPSLLRQFVDILEIPMEGALNSLLPFVRIQTPNTEQFRFDSTAYIVPFGKIPDVKYTISTVGEELFWVSPKEALARYEAGVMELPTPTLILFNEMDRLLPRYDDIKTKLTMDTEPRVITPELVHDPHTRMATVLIPGDVHHSETPALRAEAMEKRKRQAKIEPASGLSDDQKKANAEKDAKQDEQEAMPEMLYRIQYEKDEPYGVRSVLTFRPINPDEEVEELARMDEKFIQADSPQLLSFDELAKEEKAYARKQERQGIDDMKRMDKMMASGPSGGAPSQK